MRTFEPTFYRRKNNGLEFTSKAADQWAFRHDVTLDFSHPGKPTDNALIDPSTDGCAPSV